MSATASLPQAHPHGVAFTATNIASAVSQIRATLGPDAVLLNIRRVAGRGLSKLWLKPQIEVVACLPDHAPPPREPAVQASRLQSPRSLTSDPTRSDQAALDRPAGVGLPPPGSDIACGAGVSPACSDDSCAAAVPLAGSDNLCGAGVPPAPPDSALPGRPSHLRTSPHNAIQRYTLANAAPFPPTSPVADFAPPPIPLPRSILRAPARGASPASFTALASHPLHVQRVLETIQRLHGPDRLPPPSLAHELTLARSAFRQLWRPALPPSRRPPPLHVFIGPPGSGKSTVLCKWLAQTVLVEGQTARAWRLDARAPNTAELVSLYGEILNVPVERSWNGRRPTPHQLRRYSRHRLPRPRRARPSHQAPGHPPNPSVHLVLNAAYTRPPPPRPGPRLRHLPRPRPHPHSP
ncbi:MAG: hypothetical protein M5U12_15265 [Verrucomicrobia bacterium]|nr:hypothetical protein [Verrucomicrobiota bacterium]